jgi:hypothetical protein
MHIGDPDNSSYVQKVDVKGQAFTRFADGSPTLDAFGNLRVSNAHVLGAYEFTNSDMMDLFSIKELVGGTVTHNPTSSTTVLGVTGTISSESRISTNRYHYYQPGTGNLAIMTLSLNDSGKTGNVRGWGYGDYDNGLLWRLNGTTFQCGIRSKVTGTVTNTFIDQANWNGDKLDGSGPSGMILDLTKANFYWIDFAWLGVGEVRFGVLAPDGAKIVCHTFQNPNSNVGPYMQSGSLPLSYHNFNTALTSGTSEMNLICAAVYSEGATDYTYWRFNDIERDPTTVTTNTHILSMRPRYQVNGKTNRVGVYPDSLSVYVSGGNVKISIVDDATISTPTWSITGEGVVDGDISASTVSGGSKFKTWYLAPGCHDICLSCFYETNDEGYHVLADAATVDDVYSLTIVATKLDGTTVNVGASICYRELR